MKIAASIVVLLAVPALALQGGYLSQMGGGGAIKASSIKPSGGAVRGPASYLDNIAGGSSPQMPPPQVEIPPPQAQQYPPQSFAPQVFPAGPAAKSAPSGSTGYPYLDEIAAIGGGSPGGVTPVFSMSSMGGDAIPAAASNYLSSLKVAAAPSGSGPAGYLDTLRIQASQGATNNLPGYLDTLRVAASTVSGTGPMTYLDNIARSARVTAKVEATTEVTMTSNEPIMAAINRLNANMMAGQKQTINVLQDINSTMKKLVTRASSSSASSTPASSAPARSAPAPAPTAETTELTSALETSAAPSAGNYLSSLKVAAAPSGSGLSGYLDRL